MGQLLTAEPAQCALVPLDEAQRAVDAVLARLEELRVGVLEVMECAREEGGLHGPQFVETFGACLPKAMIIHLMYGFSEPRQEGVVPIDGRPLGKDVLWPVADG